MEYIVLAMAVWLFIGLAVMFASGFDPDTGTDGDFIAAGIVILWPIVLIILILEE